MAGKKSFKDALNPAMQFISTPEPEEAPAAPEKPLRASDAPEGFKVDPRFIEKKTRRLQLLLRPSLFERLKARAEAEGLSVNELTDILLEDALSDQKKRR